MQWATLNSCLSTHLSIHASAVCLSTVFLRAPSTPESKGSGQTESNQPPPAVNAAVSGPPPRAPLEGLLSLCPSASAQGGGCAQTLRVQRAQEHGRLGPPGAPPAKQLKVMINAQPPVLWQRWGRARVPLSAGLQGADPRCPLGRPLTGCQQLSSPGFPSSLGACSWGLHPIPDPAPHPGLPVCSEDISDAIHPLPVSSQAAQSDKRQDGHPKTPEEAAW